MTILFSCNFCSVHKIATEENGFDDSKRPGLDEGIAIFYFESLNDSPLPNELYFKSVDKNEEVKHFTPSSLLYNKTSKRYILLKAGTYHFVSAVYRNGTNSEEFSFPENQFTIHPKKINYIGDIQITHKRGLLEVKVKNNMNLRLAEFYPEYPKSSILYPKIESLVLFRNNPIDKWYKEQREKLKPEAEKKRKSISQYRS